MGNESWAIRGYMEEVPGLKGGAGGRAARRKSVRTTGRKAGAGGLLKRPHALTTLAKNCIAWVSLPSRREEHKRSRRGGSGVADAMSRSTPAKGRGSRGQATPAALVTIARTQAQRWGAVAGVGLRDRAAIGALAGGCAGGLTHIALHPIDTIKIKLQLKGSGSVTYSGPVDVVKKVMKQSGVRGFYQGLVPAVVGSVPSSALYFGTYELMKGTLSAHVPESMGDFVPTLAALLGNAVSSAVLVPKEVIKTRLQAGATGGALGVVRAAVAKEGLGGLYVGYASTIARNAPSNMINFTIFEYLKAIQLARTGEVGLTPGASIASGMCSGMSAALLTTPIDVAKTRLMAQGPGVHLYRGLIPTLKRVAAEEGMRGLTRGMGPRLFYSTCFNGMGFLCFERVRVELVRRKLVREAKEAEVSSI